MIRKCIKCNKEKKEDEFPTRNNGNKRNECRKCTAVIAREYRKNNKEKLRIQAAIRNYKISKNKVLELYNKEKCEICNKTFKSTKDKHIDHCHNTDKIRGILCTNCNHGLGKFEDNVLILENAIKYLKL